MLSQYINMHIFEMKLIVMELIASFLVIIFLAGLVIGLMHPNWVWIPGEKKTRHFVWIYYGLGLLVALVFLAFSLSKKTWVEDNDNAIHYEQHDIG